VIYVRAAGQDDREGKRLNLRVGDSFDLGDESWRVEKIVNPRRPLVTLTRVDE
jgi:predicted lysophospholipase L1 biosynthesis ABC-type transport system permease subunit